MTTQSTKELTKAQKKKVDKIWAMTVYGLKHKLVFPYIDELFDALRPFHYSAIPASIMLFTIDLCNGYCYDRARLMQLAFNDAKVIHADIEQLRITAGEEFAEHAIVETKEFGGGKTWIVDPSIGLVYEKNFYFKIEKPKINKVFEKKELMESPIIKEIIASDFEEEKFILPAVLPQIEYAIKHSDYIGTIVYREKLEEELEKFKKAINFNGINAEVIEDIKLMKTNPQKLDEKFGIVRDKYGREMSRNGIPDPNYKPLEQVIADNEYYKSIENDEEKLADFWQKLQKESIEEMQIRDAKISERAKKRLEEILLNPTADFYEQMSGRTGKIDEKKDEGKK